MVTFRRMRRTLNNLRFTRSRRKFARRYKGKTRRYKRSRHNINFRKSKRRRKLRRKKGQKGGMWSQFLTNRARGLGYSSGGIVNPQNLGLANPPPHFAYKRCGS